MSLRSDHLRRRRQLLVARAAAQRDEVGFVAAQLQHRLRIVNLGFSAGQVLRDHPLLALAGTTLLLRTPGGKLVTWLSRVYTGWELLGALRKQWAQRAPSN